MVNDGGGINGRKVNFVAYDDGYQPPRTVELTRKAVEADKVLFMAGSMGTSPQLAVAPYLNQKKIPQLFLAAAASKLADAKVHPYTLILSSTYEVEGAAWARYLAANKANAKVAVIYQDDDAGRAILAGFKEAAARTSLKVVAEQTYTVTDATVDSQVIAMKDSGADTVLLITIPKMTALSLRKIRAMSWDPLIITSSGGSSPKTAFAPVGLENAKGVLTTNFRIPANAPQYQANPEVKAYREFLAKHLPGVDPSDEAYAFGYSAAAATTQLLRTAGDNLTRENIHRLATNLQSFRIPLMLPGVTANTTPDDARPIKQVQFFRFNGADYDTVGDVVTVK
jgi:branched-chain amino acid transport system substrate-binding protein